MDIAFKHAFSFVSQDGLCSPIVKGLMRKDESAAIIPSSEESVLQDVYKLRYYRAKSEIREYTISGYHLDTQRPVSKWLIKPIVIDLKKETPNNKK